MRRLDISHVTEYQFFASVSLQPHRLLPRPRESHNVRIESSILEILPAYTLQWKRDVLDNSVALVSFPEPSARLRIASSVVIQHYEDNPFDFLLDDYAVIHPFDYAEDDGIELAPFLQSVYPSDREAVQRWLDGLDLPRPLQTFTLLDRINRLASDGDQEVVTAADQAADGVDEDLEGLVECGAVGGEAVEGLADYIDVFCDRGFFTEAQTSRILEAGATFGMVPKIHANELDFSGGVQVGVR